METQVECFVLVKLQLKVNNLIDTTYESMMLAIKTLKPGLRLGDIGHTIQSFVEKKGFSVVRDFVDTVLALHFMKRQIFYIMARKYRNGIKARNDFYY